MILLKVERNSTLACLAAYLCLLAPSARAGADESIVYGGEITPVGESAFDMYAKLAKTAGASDLRGRTAFHTFGEFAYGVAKQWEVALKVPLAHADGKWYGNGAYAEVTYVAPHEGQGLSWGAEVEAGNVSSIDAERAWVVEFVPIIAYSHGNWNFVANPALEYTAEDNESGISFEPKLKAAYQYDQHNAFGIEYHIDAGLLKHITARGQRNEVAYLTWDTRMGEHRVSMGIGRGTTSASERWAAKITIDLDD